ncbi:hypothetical protein [Alteromonas gilva]|uniref:Uncharacterized protein n=1 Tax=Alteromonas gilva TaxID=2987522 RepID=A0ABT5L2R3_9ALTE|nr:hypothetical protein [Alteromonas gilva]MDC8830691.1 hypothetical protein [Alteromonas gilva]
MQKLTKWTLGALVVCSGVFAGPQTASVTRLVNKESAAPLKSPDEPYRSPVIVQLEQQVKMTHFDPKQRLHGLRFKRIVHYLSEARGYDEKHSMYNRDEALTRAANILRHHQVKTGQYYEL